MTSLILMPAWNSSRTLPAVTKRLDLLDPQPDLYIFLENNSTDDTLQQLVDFKHPKEIIRLWFRDDAIDFCDTRTDIIAIVRQFLLQRTRQINPDYAIFLDSDVQVVSTDMIPRLTRWDDQADIVGGAYPIGPTLIVSALWPGMLVRPAIKRPGIRLEECMCVGGGCMCINRRLIQDRRINFYPVTEAKDVADAEDWLYCYKAWMLGYVVALDWTVELIHWTADKAFSRPWILGRDLKPVPFRFCLDGSPMRGD